MRPSYVANSRHAHRAVRGDMTSCTDVVEVAIAERKESITGGLTPEVSVRGQEAKALKRHGSLVDGRVGHGRGLGPVGSKAVVDRV
tara:strand:+ start:661 stop:918 length:258 start_codon:yes stop_codon:yes gene_type:complete